MLGLPLAHWWKRLVAWIIDYAVTVAFVYIVYLVVIIPTTVATVALRTHGPTRPVPVGAVVGLIVVAALALIAPGIYNGLGDGKFRGQTLGKLALGIAVRDSRSNRLIGFWRGFGRFYFNVLLAVVFYIPFIIGNLAPLWDTRRQSWTDHVVSSVVVDLKP